MLVGCCGRKHANSADVTPPWEGSREQALTLADQGWLLWKAGTFEAEFRGGRYTNPDPSTQVHDFWSDGTYVRVDPGDDGLFEYSFQIVNDRPVYLGKTGEDGTFVDASPSHETLLGKTLEQAGMY